MWAIIYSEQILFSLEENVRRGGFSNANGKLANSDPVVIDKSDQEHPEPYDYTNDPEDMSNLQDGRYDPETWDTTQVRPAGPSWRDLMPEQPDRERPDMDRDMSDWLNPYFEPEESSRLPDRYGWDQYDTGYFY